MDTAALRTAQPHTVHVEVKADHLQALARAKPVNALAELIWNAVDADADNVWIEIDDNDLGTPEVIRVIDDGDGIAFDRVQAAFGNLGESWKKKRHQTLRSAKRLHGRDGKGRLKAFSLGNHVSWRTTYLGQDRRFTYEIKGALHDICDFPYADPVAVVGPGDRGTTVTITGIEEKLSVFAEDGSAEQQLSELFAIYLRDYPATKIFFRGQRLNISAVQHAAKTMPLTSFFVDGAEVSGSVEVIEWRFAKSERKLCLCDDVGYRLHEIDALIRPGAEFNFTAYLKSDYISRLHDQGVLDLAELDTGLTKLVEDARNQLRSYFRQRKAATAASLVDEWKREGIYPFKEETADPVERARREVFDIAAVNVNEYLDAFRLGGLKERKLTLKLIATAVDAPEELKKILGDVLELPKDKLKDFADLLEHTTLPQMIEANKTVLDRLAFLKGLEEMMFEQPLKKATKERKHLQKILEVETWIFGEEFALTNSDENLTTVLRKHLALLRPELARKRKKGADFERVLLDDGSEGVIDLLLGRLLPQYGTPRREYLVVELKRPDQKIDLDVKGQIEKYALAVMAEARFDAANTHWTFIAVGAELTESARKTVEQKDKPIGYFHVGNNFKIGLVEWSTIIGMSRARLEFFKHRLGVTASKDDGLQLLHKKYRKFMPEVIDRLVGK